MGWEMADENKQIPEPPRTEKEPKKQPKEAKPKKKHGCLFKLIVAVVIVIAIAIAAMEIQQFQKDNASYTWPTSGISALLPQPSSDKGEIALNSDDSFKADIKKTSQADYSNYLTACKEKGFTVDANSTALGYSAFNEDGYELKLSYSSSSQEMDIDLAAPIEMGSLSWPTMGAAALVPAPQATRGKIVSDSDSTFNAYVGDTDIDAFNAYVDSCIAAGYDVDHNRTDTSYSAKNTDGAKVSVSYEGANVARIYVTAPKEEKAPEATAQSEEPAKENTADQTADAQQDAANQMKDDEVSTSDKAKDALGSLVNTVTDAASGLVTPEFKEMMDGYEAFMDSYCDFMVKYTDASNSGDSASLSAMMGDYTSLMQQEIEWADKVNAVDQGSLSAADTAYYLAVTGRVTQKLIDMGVSLG